MQADILSRGLWWCHRYRQDAGIFWFMQNDFISYWVLSYKWDSYLCRNWLPSWDSDWTKDQHSTPPRIGWPTWQITKAHMLPAQNIISKKWKNNLIDISVKIQVHLEFSDIIKFYFCFVLDKEKNLAFLSLSLNNVCAFIYIYIDIYRYMSELKINLQLYKVKVLLVP